MCSIPCTCSSKPAKKTSEGNALMFFLALVRASLQGEQKNSEENASMTSLAPVLASLQGEAKINDGKEHAVVNVRNTASLYVALRCTILHLLKK